MEDYKKALSTFIEKKGYLNNKDVLGIVLYGSYTTGFNHTKSDIDVHVIMSNNVEQLIRGAEMHDGFKIEYFEKPIHDLYESADNDFVTQNNALVPIIGHGIILFDRYGEIVNLKNYILNKFSTPLPPLSGDDAKEMAVIIENRITQLEVMFNSSRIDFNHNYHLLIEKIRKFYSRLCGCPDIPVAKAFKIYTNEKYRESFCKSIIPDAEFIDMYFKAITCDENEKQKLEHVYNLYKYSIRALDIDPNNYRILIKSRNNPINKNHE